ncbi:hypothetical protein RSK20926_11934 [Roseobacter sp. SK209-2-6]|nr:hypothetical protein RSK20926_11934 [Roseobacter sp. SK209-2-6]
MNLTVLVLPGARGAAFHEYLFFN